MQAASKPLLPPLVPARSTACSIESEDGHLRAGKDYIAAGMFVIPTGTFTLGLKDAGTWRFHIDETMTFVRPTRMILPGDTKSWELSFNASNRHTYAERVQKWITENESKYAFRYLGALA